MAFSFIFLILGVLGVGAGVALVAVLWAVLAKRKSNNDQLPVLSEDERRLFLHQCDNVLQTFKAVVEQHGGRRLGIAAGELYPLLVKWREHLASLGLIPVTVKELPTRWVVLQQLLMRAVEAEEKQVVGADDAVREVEASFASTARDYRVLLEEAERGQTNDLVVEARVLQRLAEMDDALHPHQGSRAASERSL